MAINYWNPHTFNLPKRLASATLADIQDKFAREILKEQAKPWLDEVLALRTSPNMKRSYPLNMGCIGLEVAENAWAICLKYLHERDFEAYAMFNSTIEEDIKDDTFRNQCYRSPVLGVFGLGSLRSLSFQAQTFIKSVLESRFYAMKPMVFYSKSSENILGVLGANGQDPNKFFPRLFSESETGWILLGDGE